VYVGESTKDTSLDSKLVGDAKTDYPSACNAAETLLLPFDAPGYLESTLAMSALMSLRAAEVKCLEEPRAMSAGLCDIAAQEMKYECEDFTCIVIVEAVISMSWSYRSHCLRKRQRGR